MNHAASVLSLCSSLESEGRYAVAIGVIRQALERDSEAGALWRRLGLLLHQTEDFGAARDALEVASSLVPLEPSSLLVMAICYARTGQPRAAADLYQQLVESGDTPTELLIEVASGLGSIGAFQDALHTCRVLLQRAPDSHEAYFGIAYYLRRLGNSCEAAYPMIVRAHELAPSVLLYRVTLAWMLVHAGRWEDAYELIQDVDPNTVCCCGCLRRIWAIALHSGNVALAQRFRERVELLDRSKDRNSAHKARPTT